jgi:hypothetical protein
VRRMNEGEEDGDVTEGRDNGMGSHGETPGIGAPSRGARQGDSADWSSLTLYPLSFILRPSSFIPHCEMPN